MSPTALEAAWKAVEGGATLAQACQAAGVAGVARGALIADLRTLLAGEARLLRVAPELRSALQRLQALRALAGEESGALGAGLSAAELRGRETRLLAQADPLLCLAQRGSVSSEVALGLQASLGDSAAAFLSASWSPAALCLRANAARTTREELQARLAREGVASEPGPWSPWSLRVLGAGALPPTKAFEEGLFEVQDEASQLVARLVDPPRSAPTIDACAGAGGKTLALCALLGTRGRVVALDPDERHLAELRRRAARAQAFNLLVHATPADTGTLALPLRDLVGRAARVLVDAPCSGLGALRRKPDIARRVDAALLERLPAQQLEIARAALRWLRPDGRLVYVTCTPLAAENEAVVEQLCAQERLVALPQREWLPPELQALSADLETPALRLLPHVHGTDAFTVHVLRRA